MACENKNVDFGVIVEMVNFIISIKHDTIHSVDLRGNTILHSAIITSNWKLVKYFLQSGDIYDYCIDGKNLVRQDIFSLTIDLVNNCDDYREEERKRVLKVLFCYCRDAKIIDSLLLDEDGPIMQYSMDKSIIHKWRAEFGICDVPQFFLLVVGLCDGYFVLLEKHPWFQIIIRLPSEVQMIICNYACYVKKKYNWKTSRSVYFQDFRVVYLPSK